MKSKTPYQCNDHHPRQDQGGIRLKINAKRKSVEMSQSHDLHHEPHHFQWPPPSMPSNHNHNRHNHINRLNNNHNFMLSEGVVWLW